MMLPMISLKSIRTVSKNDLGRLLQWNTTHLSGSLP